MAEYYGTSPTVPAELIVPAQIRETAQLASFLEGLRGTKVEVRQAERGDKRRLREMAERNAALALAHERLREERTRERRLGALTALETALGLDGPPMRIEGFDISNLGAENIVASMVVFEGGVAKKSDYRKFAIAYHRRAGRRGGHSRCLAGAVARAVPVARLAGERPATERYDPSFEAVPDLVLIDGGKGQLGAALAALQRDRAWSAAVAVISLAKREEEVFAPWSPDAAGSGAATIPGLLLLQRVRDEAHRFALGFHRRKRDASHHRLAARPASGHRREAEAGDHAALRLAGEIPAGQPERRLEAVPGSAGQGGKGGARVCPQDRLTGQRLAGRQAGPVAAVPLRTHRVGRGLGDRRCEDGWSRSICRATALGGADAAATGEGSRRRPGGRATGGSRSSRRTSAASVCAGRPERWRWSDLGVPDFDRKVYEALLSVPPAETVSYGGLAELAGYPRAARAVGSAMANNPIPIVDPVPSGDQVRRPAVATTAMTPAGRCGCSSTRRERTSLGRERVRDERRPRPDRSST